MKKYGIKEETEDGDVFYHGKGLHDLISFNVTAAPERIIDGQKYHAANLDAELIEKYGYATQSNAEKALERINKKYPSMFAWSKASIVELSTDLVVRINLDALVEKMNRACK